MSEIKNVIIKMKTSLNYYNVNNKKNIHILDIKIWCMYFMLYSFIELYWTSQDLKKCKSQANVICVLEGYK